MNANTAAPPCPSLDHRIRRYDIWLADLPREENSHVQSGIRPVVIVSNDGATLHSPVVSIVPLTSRLNKIALPTHVFLRADGLDRASLALCEQIITLDKGRLLRRLGEVTDPFQRLSIQHSLAVHLGMIA